MLDQGGQNRVYKVKNQATGQTYVSKTPKIEKNPKFSEQLTKECAILERLKGV